MAPAQQAPRQPRRRAARAVLLTAAAACASWASLAPAGAGGPAFAHTPAPELQDEGLGAKLKGVAAAHSGIFAVAAAVLCALLSREEPPRAPTPQVPIEKRPDFVSVCAMSGLLCAVSGMVNAVAIIEMGGTVAHQTGNMSHFGRLLGIDGARFGLLLLCFFLGAGVVGYRKADGDALFEGRYCPSLLAGAVGTTLGVFLHYAHGHGDMATMPLWAFAQGMQNAVCSRFSTMPMRTTHHTGTLTDAAAGLGLYVRARLHGEPLPPLQRPTVLCICMFSYIGGGVAAKAGTDVWGIFAALPPAAVMAVLAAGWVPIAAAPAKKA